MHFAKPHIYTEFLRVSLEIVKEVREKSISSLNMLLVASQMMSGSGLSKFNDDVLDDFNSELSHACEISSRAVGM